MIIDADDQSGSWNGKYYYDFLIDDRDGHPDPVDLAIELREIIEERPPTATTINLRMFMSDKKVRHVTDELIYFVGAWRNPYPHTAGYQIVNPNSPHIHKYSDTLTWCDDCKHAFLQPTQAKKQAVSISDHLDCPMYHKQHTNSEINRKRASILRTALRLDYDASFLPGRFGLNSNTIKPRFAERLKVDMTKERQAGKRLVNNTMAHLVFRHSTKKVAKAFDMSRFNVTNRVKNNTGVSPQKAYEQRRWG